jgi:hypothetical protein
MELRNVIADQSPYRERGQRRRHCHLVCCRAAFAGEPLRRIPKEIVSVAFNADGDTLAYSNLDKPAHLWASVY